MRIYLDVCCLNRPFDDLPAACGIRQFSAGRGDYTAERDALLRDITPDEIIRNVREAES